MAYYFLAYHPVAESAFTFREHLKHIPRMCSEQDSVLPQGVGLRKPHITLHSLLLSSHSLHISSLSSLRTSYFLLLSSRASLDWGRKWKSTSFRVCFSVIMGRGNGVLGLIGGIFLYLFRYFGGNRCFSVCKFLRNVGYYVKILVTKEQRARCIHT